MWHALWDLINISFTLLNWARDHLYFLPPLPRHSCHTSLADFIVKGCIWLSIQLDYQVGRQWKNKTPEQLPTPLSSPCQGRETNDINKIRNTASASPQPLSGQEKPEEARLKNIIDYTINKTMTPMRYL